MNIKEWWKVVRKKRNTLLKFLGVDTSDFEGKQVIKETQPHKKLWSHGGNRDRR